jgi:microcystin-dependent protein
MCIFGFNFAPRDWAFCNGQIMAISQNEALFSILGTTYGGNGQTTFALPNTNERLVNNWGTGPGLSTYTLGEVSGVSSVTLTSGQMPQHTHSLNTYTGSTRDLAPTANGWLGEGALPGFLFQNGVAPDQTLSPGFIGQAGSSQPHTNEQPFLAMNYCIALYGIFPTRN